MRSSFWLQLMDVVIARHTLEECGLKLFAMGIHRRRGDAAHGERGDDCWFSPDLTGRLLDLSLRESLQAKEPLQRAAICTVKVDQPTLTPGNEPLLVSDLPDEGRLQPGDYGWR
jgi:hypothetical protein